MKLADTFSVSFFLAKDSTINTRCSTEELPSTLLPANEGYILDSSNAIRHNPISYLKLRQPFLRFLLGKSDKNAHAKYSDITY
jgi:hypothetical protein